MVCTALVESKLTHLKQLPEGPALGFHQVEWATYLDVCRYLHGKDTLRSKILLYCDRPYMPTKPHALIGDLILNLLVARVKYWMQPEAIPTYKDPISQASYYERYYNGNVNVDKTQEFIRYAKDIEGWIIHEDASKDQGLS